MVKLSAEKLFRLSAELRVVNEFGSYSRLDKVPSEPNECADPKELIEFIGLAVPDSAVGGNDSADFKELNELNELTELKTPTVAVMELKSLSELRDVSEPIDVCSEPGSQPEESCDLPVEKEIF